MELVSFKERVAQAAVQQARRYQDVFVNFEYLLCSEAFVKQDYYILAAAADNYRHLIGVNTSISADAFFQKCIDGTLDENDFDFMKPGRFPHDVKGSVRRKIKSLPFFMSMLENDFVVQEDYAKNGIICSFAATDCNISVGFTNAGKARPKTLLWGDSLDWDKAAYADLVLRRRPGDKLFSEVIIGGGQELLKYEKKIRSVAAPELFQKLPVEV